jgi:hypothetical protein
VIVGTDGTAGWVTGGTVEEATKGGAVGRVDATVDGAGDDGEVVGWLEAEHAATTSAAAPAAMIGLLRLRR